MSTPALPPRHLPHRGAGTEVGPFGGRQAARIRALVAADLLPPERAAADALVMTAWLTPAQRATYAASLRCGDHPEDLAQVLADERRVVLEEGADPVADELESAAQAERAAAQRALRILEALLLVVALGAVVALVLPMLGGPGDEAVRAALPAAAVLVGAVVPAAAVGALATRRRDRALLDWASSRPGQLGRGLPLHRPLQGGSAGPAILRALAPALLVAAGVLAIVAGAAILLITLMLGDEQGMASAAPWLLGGGVVSLLVAVLAVHLRGRRVMRQVRRARAAEWLGAAPHPGEGS